ncbi:MAG: sigE 1 [Phycisphaerales bacterium]|nr:sigE 1 [Phycisphaerales bacterium]
MLRTSVRTSWQMCYPPPERGVERAGCKKGSSAGDLKDARPRRTDFAMADWDGIVSREGPAVWRTAYRLLGNHADAEECFQETFLAALRLAERQPLRDAHAALQRLATARAMDRLRQRYRRRGREEAADWETHPGDHPSPGEHAETMELSERLRSALSELPGKQAEAFCLFGLEGWTYQEIAGHLGISVDNVGVLLHRARAKLRTLLAIIEVRP